MDDVEFATMNWIHWWNTNWLHDHLRHRTSAEVEAAYYETHPSEESLATV